MKKIFIGALMSVMLMSFGTFTEASQVEQVNACCRGYCYQDCDESSGEYCGRYGCGQDDYRGGHHHGR